MRTCLKRQTLEYPVEMQPKEKKAILTDLLLCKVCIVLSLAVDADLKLKLITLPSQDTPIIFSVFF